jgi:SAM-dependent methyltransferase
LRAARARAEAEPAIWQDVEFGAYRGDLGLWEELARAADGPVLELGAGAGRISMHLAASGVDVIALERDPALAAALEDRAGQQGLGIRVITADVRDLARISLEPSPALALAPLHLIQQIDPEHRPALLRALSSTLTDGGRFAATVVDEASFLTEGVSDGPQAKPDMREVDRWVYSSEPLWVQVDEQTLTVRRLRQIVAPDGELTRRVEDELLHRISPEKLELDAEQAGFEPLERRPIVSGPREANSIAVVVGK